MASQKYPDVGTLPGYFVDTDSTQVPRGRVALFAGFTDGRGQPDRTMSARLVGTADSIDDLRARHPEAFQPQGLGRTDGYGGDLMEGGY